MKRLPRSLATITAPTNGSPMPRQVSARDSGIGMLGCLLDLGLLSPGEWRGHVDDFERAGEAV